MAKYVNEDGVKAIRDWVKVHDNKSLYNLGYYDTYDASTNTITRQTGYHNISNDLIEHGYYRTTMNGHGEYGSDIGIHNLPIVSEQKSFINNLLIVRDTGEVYAGSIGIAITRDGGCWMNLGDDYTTKEKYVEYLSKNNIYIQYKLATATTEKVEANHYARYNERFILEHNKSEAERSCNLYNGVQTCSGSDTRTSFVARILFFNDNTRISDVWFNKQIATTNTLVTLSFTKPTNANRMKFGHSGATKDVDVDYDITNLPNGTYTLSFLVTGYTGTQSFTNIMLNEGSVALPYQPYEGKVIHEKDLGNYTNIFNVSQLYRHDYEIENQVGDTIYVHCWSTQNTKIKLYDITAYAFSNIQVYNTSNEEAINVLKWETSGFYYIADNGTIAGNSYTVIHYYINGEPTTY